MDQKESRGLFFTIEGMDGSGKSTQAIMLKEYVQSKGYTVLLTREPGGTEIGEKVRQIVLDKYHTEMHDITEALLYAAARSQHVAEVIVPNLNKGNVVICDRFVDSSIAYQGGGRELGQAVKEINDIAIMGCMPHMTFLLMIDPSVGKSRINDHDRIEMEEIDYHNRVYQEYKSLSQKYPERIKRIDATGTPEEIHVQIKKYIDEVLYDFS